jgi:hypothetical protein
MDNVIKTINYEPFLCDGPGRDITGNELQIAPGKQTIKSENTEVAI